MHKPAIEAGGGSYDGGNSPAGRPRPAGAVSLEGIHSSVPVPENPTEFWRNWRAYVGPALLVSVGYMDPGNWATSLAGGSAFG
jgi:manganese transport protein